MTARASLSIEQLELTVEGERPKRRRNADTSRAADRRGAPETITLRDQVLAVFRQRGIIGATADEVHEELAQTEAQRNDVRRLMSVRRRVSDLHTQLKQIRDTGTRRNNGVGNAMIVWEIVDASAEAAHGE